MINDNLSGGDLGQGSTADRLREKAAGLAGQAKEQASTLFDQRKTSAVSEIDGLVSALRQAGGQMEGSQFAGRLITTAAEKLESVSRAIDNRSIDDLKDDVERRARRNPAVFLGGAVAIGLIAARFLKSSGSGVSSRPAGFAMPNTVRNDFETPITPRGSDYDIGGLR
ncbi:MAG: hypothetical protein QOH21_489 [Acidobacteriota bacterium]|nr:hypothetical protein [Acidobacteriota bacterium]